MNLTHKIKCLLNQAIRTKYYVINKTKLSNSGAQFHSSIKSTIRKLPTDMKHFVLLTFAHKQKKYLYIALSFISVKSLELLFMSMLAISTA